MRIAFLVHTFPSLSQTFILSQITGLIALGHDVDIYADRPDVVSLAHPDVKAHGIQDRAHYPNIPENYFSRVLKGFHLLLANGSKAPRVLLRSCNILRYRKEAVSLRLLYGAVSHLNRRQYDIIHCHFGPNGLKGMMLREIGAIQGKLVTTFYGYDVSSYPKKNGHNCYDRLFQKGDLFITISETMRSRLIELGCNEKELVKHPLGIDPYRFSRITSQPRHDGRVRIVTIGRLVPKKGIEYGVRAVAMLLRTNPRIDYTIVGDGPLRERIQRIIADLGADHAIKLVGWKQWPEVVDILNCSDILLAPSFTSDEGDQEGTPVVLMEALAMGIPVVSTWHSGIPEVVENRVSGLLVPERDVTALGEALEYLAEHPEIRIKMGRAGRESIKTRYNIDKLNARLVGIYQKISRKQQHD